MSKQELVAHNRSAILALAAKHGVSNVRLFGSAARGEAGKDSDVDFFVKLDAGKGAFDLLDFIDELESLLSCKVDVLTEHRWMRERLRQNILRDAVAL
jgi:uncharacterized protein